MEVIKWTLLASLSCCVAAPVTAQQACYPLEHSLENMATFGYAITFLDAVIVPTFGIAENGKGDWVAFIIDGENLCPLVEGADGTRFTLPPNT